MTDAGRRHRPAANNSFGVFPWRRIHQQGKEASAMLLILCIVTGIATVALMSWLQPALERWAVRNPPR
jgi:hypothetical protein